MGLFYIICKRERENDIKRLDNIPVRIGNSGADLGMHADTNVCRSITTHANGYGRTTAPSLH